MPQLLRIAGLLGGPHDVVTKHPASGLVTALEPVLRACAGVWIAHGSGSADRAAADRDGRVVAAGDSPYLLRRVWLTDDEERGYYYGFSNYEWGARMLIDASHLRERDHLLGRLTPALAQTAVHMA